MLDQITKDYTNNEIAAMLRELLSLLKNNKSKTSNEPLDTFLRSWYSDFVRPNISDVTSVNYETYLFERITPALGKIPLNELTANHLQHYLVSIKQGNTRKKIRFLLNRALNKAVVLGKIERNPFIATEIPSYHKTHYRALEFSEQNAVLNRIKRRPFYNAVFNVLCCTGLRIGEFLAVDWENDVDYENGFIRINKTRDIHTGIVHNSTKTLAGERDVPILPELYPYIETLKSEPMPPYSAVRSYFRRVYNFLKIDKANQHAMRHTFISLCHVAGVQPKFVQAIVGHRDIEMTLNVYTHVMKKGTSPLLDYVRKLATHLNGYYV